MNDLPDFDALWNYERPAESERTFRELLRAAPPNSTGALLIMTQIARAQGLQRHFEAAHTTLDAVEQALEARMDAARVWLLLERGRLFRSQGEPERARPLFEQAWELGNQLHEAGGAVDAAHMLGILEAPELTWNLRALQVAETSSDPLARRWLATLYNNIGWTHHERGEYAQALELFERALRLREAQGQPPAIRVARWMIARVLRSLGRLEEALALQQALTTENQQVGETDPYVEEELGECLLALGRGEAARPHFANAYSVLSQDDLLMKYERPRLERLRALAKG